MKDSIIKLLETDSNLLIFIGTLITISASLITFIITRISSKNRFKHENTLRCIETFRRVFEKGSIDKNNVQNYLGIIDEELFYLKHKMVNRRLGKEWIANLINYLPVFFKNETEIIAFNKNILIERKEFFSYKSSWEFLFAYPRILDVIYIKESDLEVFKCVEKSSTAIIQIGEAYYLNPSKVIEQEYENHKIIEIIKEYLALLMFRNLKKREGCSFLTVLVLYIKIKCSQCKLKKHFKKKMRRENNF